MPPKAKPAVQTTLDGKPVPPPAPKVAKPRAKPKPKPVDGEEDDSATPVGGLSDQKLPLPQWLKLFTERGVDMRLAMTLAGKL